MVLSEAAGCAGAQRERTRSTGSRGVNRIDETVPVEMCLGVLVYGAGSAEDCNAASALPLDQGWLPLAGRRRDCFVRETTARKSL